VKPSGVPQLRWRAAGCRLRGEHVVELCRKGLPGPCQLRCTENDGSAPLGVQRNMGTV
jgi:hypothetical protein